MGPPDIIRFGFGNEGLLVPWDAVEHEDSAGHRGVINAGDVQWRTAGGGIIHSEMPTKALLENGGRVHGLQIWVNLPRRLKLTTPRYQDVPAAKIPEAKTADGLARAKIIAGSALGVNAVIETHTPIVFQDWQLEPGADVTVEVSQDQQVLAYVFEGAIAIDGREVRDGQMASLGEGDAVRLQGAAERGRLLLLAGVPHREPVARYGPFVMTTERELMQAFQDYQSGRMGEITRTARVG
jgi:redox-sensitive bicupin YhaK (pirin superfamily)